MKKLIAAAVFLLSVRVSAQATNPQKTFDSAVSINNPSLWLNFNDSSATFKDTASGSSFTSGVTQLVAAPTSCTNVPSGTAANSATCTMTTTAGDTAILFGDSQGSTVTSMTDSGGATCTIITSSIFSGANVYAYSCANLTSGSHTFTMHLSAASAYTPLQGVDVTGAAAASPVDAFTPFNVVASASTTFTSGSLTSTQGGDQLVGWMLGSSGTYTLNSGFSAFGSGGWTGIFPATRGTVAPGSYAMAGNMSTSGYAAIVVAVKSATSQSNTVSVRQPGFDNTNNSNFSAEFPYNAWNAAPNNTLSAIDWNVPWTMLLHVNKMNWDHVGNIVLASKGDLNGSAINNVWWELYLQPNAGNSSASQLCFTRNGPAPDTETTGNTFVANQTWCSPRYQDVMPNSFNYDIVLEDNGSGSPGAVNMWINGSAQPLVAQANGGFGGITVAITSGGTGYTSAPTLRSTGGGINCTIAGSTAAVSSGAISSTNIISSGCTSTPAITVTGGGGSGAVLTATAYPMTMNSSSEPLMVPGYVNKGVLYGPGGTDTSENPLYIDEFAEFPGNLSFGQITNIFYETKFYQGLLYPGLTSSPPLVIFEGYGCGPDFSGDQTLAMVIGAHEAGLIRLIGAEDDDGNGNGSNSIGWWRQMLDQAGLDDVPLSVGANSPTANIGGCPASQIGAYNANTPQNASSYESATTMLRTLYAKYLSTPIDMLMTQTANGYNGFQLSPADSISPLTGLQLQAQNYANGGWVNGFNGNILVDQSYYNSVFSNIGTGPLYMWGGSPSPGGPGVLVSRTIGDPLYQVATQMAVGDAVSGWTNLNLTQMISPYFYGGVQIAVSGGTGYAAITPFTSVGGGPNCNVTGIMEASGGVPSSMDTAWNTAVGSSYDGIGYGCNPALFTATGSGTNLTVAAITLGHIAIGDTLSGLGIPTGTTIASQASGSSGGIGVYVTNVATTASAAAITGTPTIVLTAPNGAGAVFTVTNGTFPQNYGGTGAGQYTIYSSQWAEAGSASNASVFTWFQNSLIDPPTTGTPRPY